MGRAAREDRYTPEEDALLGTMSDREAAKLMGRSWIAVSGYAGDRIFYRKSNLACGGTRWHHIELFYPRERKRAMDATVTHIARAMTAYADDCGPGRQR